MLGGMILTGICGCSGSAASLAPVETGNQTEQADAQDQEAARDLFAMDTFMTIRTYGQRAEEAAAAAQEEIYELDAMLSTGQDSSEISALNRDGQAKVSPQTFEMGQRAREIWESTGGAFNITVYPLMKAWGFTDENYRIPDESELQQLLELVDMEKVSFDQEQSRISLEKEGMAIDLGGIAKGYTSARLMDIFREYGLTSAMVSLGGNVQVLGTRPDGQPWRVGIEDPDGDGYLGVLQTQDRAVITSGGYERYFEQDGERYHHILDPETGRPARSGLVSVTIVSADGTLADALSTSLFIMGREKAADYWRQHPDEFDMILQEDDGSIWVSEGIWDDFTPEAEANKISR